MHLIFFPSDTKSRRAVFECVRASSCSSETAPTPAPVGDHRHSTKRTTRGPRRRRASRDACIAQSSKAMSPRDGRWFEFKRSLRRVFESLLSVTSKKGGDATLATLLVGTRARGGLRSGGSARTNFCTKERPTTHCALGGSMERIDVVSVNEKKISSVFQMSNHILP